MVAWCVSVAPKSSEKILTSGTASLCDTSTRKKQMGMTRFSLRIYWQLYGTSTCGGNHQPFHKNSFQENDLFAIVVGGIFVLCLWYSSSSTFWFSIMSLKLLLSRDDERRFSLFSSATGSRYRCCWGTEHVWLVRSTTMNSDSSWTGMLWRWRFRTCWWKFKLLPDDAAWKHIWWALHPRHHDIHYFGALIEAIRSTLAMLKEGD